MLRYKLVIGICDSATSQKLLMDPELTLEKAIKTVRQNTAVKEQQRQLKQLKEGGKGNPITIEEVYIRTTYLVMVAPMSLAQL